MKVVINRCYGGFSLSALAVKRLAELQGKACHFFKVPFGPEKRQWEPMSIEKCDGRFPIWTAFSIPNPQEVLGGFDWHSATQDERVKHNELYSSLSLDSRPDDRGDPLLVQVVEELGEASYGGYANLKVVEIPDDVDYEIDEYDGMEHVAEKHRTWG